MCPRHVRRKRKGGQASPGSQELRRIESLAYPLHYTQAAVSPARRQMRPMHATSPVVETRANHAPPLISARGLSKIYSTGSSEVMALKELDFEIYDGEFVSVVGQSGCGKSTLLKVLAGL